MMVEFLRRISRRIVGEIFVRVNMMGISHQNTGLTMVVMVPMGRGRRMKTGAKHREQNQELENNAPHRARLAEQYSRSKPITCAVPGPGHVEVPLGSALARRR